MLLEFFTLYFIEKRLIMTSSVIESSLVGLVLLAEHLDSDVSNFTWQGLAEWLWTSFLAFLWKFGFCICEIWIIINTFQVLHIEVSYMNKMVLSENITWKQINNYSPLLEELFIMVQFRLYIVYLNSFWCFQFWSNKDLPSSFRKKRWILKKLIKILLKISIQVL